MKWPYLFRDFKTGELFADDSCATPGTPTLGKSESPDRPCKKAVTGYHKPTKTELDPYTPGITEVGRVPTTYKLIHGLSLLTRGIAK